MVKPLRRKWKSKRAVNVRLGSVNNELATVSEIEEGDVEESWGIASASIVI